MNAGRTLAGFRKAPTHGHTCTRQRYQCFAAAPAAGRALASLLAALWLSGSVERAHAQNAFNAHSDLLGIQLGDSIVTIKKKIAEKFPGSQSYDVTDTLSTPEYKEEFNIGTLFDITTAQESSANDIKNNDDRRDADARKAAGLSTGSPLDRRLASSGDFGQERIAVTWYSNARGAGSNVFGIARVKEFLKTDRPLLANTIAALSEKYGRPVQESKADPRNKYLYWASNTNIDRRKCLKDSNSPLLYENAGLYQIEPFVRNADSMRIYFLGKVNNIHNNNPLDDLSKCGIVMRAHLVVSDDQQYVAQLNESLVDLTGGQSALKSLGDGFFAEVDKIKNEKLQSAGQKTPKL
jgi:hypothetical protein